MRRLGATPTDEGTRFEVWAPNASSVDIVTESAAFALTPDAGDAGVPLWVGTAPGIGAGESYRIRLDGAGEFPDPASRWQPDGVAGPSAVVDTGAFAWTDHGWPGVALADVVLYELHVGTFTPAGTFDAAIGQLGRLAELGVTMIEVMPVNAFPGRRNWGYDGVFPYAVQQSYGGPAGLARFVDAAHGHGLGVMLDVVYNHLGPEGNVLPHFGPYFTDAYRTPWGSAVNVAGAGSDAVRRYFVENATGWIEDFHIDGLRVDAVHAIVDPTARPMMETLVAAVHATGARLGRPVVVTLESAANDPRMIRPVEAHGWGADAVWNDDVHHALRVALTGESHEYYAGYQGARDLAAALEHRWVYRGQYSPVVGRRHGAPADDVDAGRFIVFSSNHDHVGNTPRGLRFLHDGGPADPRRRLAAAFVILSPFTPLLFMGEEYGEPAPFPYFVDHADPALIEAVRQGRAREFAGVDWGGGVADPAAAETFESAVLDPSIGSSGAHAALLAMYTELLRLRREIGVLTDPAATNIVGVDGDVIVVDRAVAGISTTLVLNFSDRTAEVPRPSGTLEFDTSSPRWGGSDSRQDNVLDNVLDSGPDSVLPAFCAQLWVQRPG